MCEMNLFIVCSQLLKYFCNIYKANRFVMNIFSTDSKSPQVPNDTSKL